MSDLDWQNSVEEIRPYVFQISTPRGRETGFLFAYTADNSTCGVATAAHVIGESQYWEVPIRVRHYKSQESLFLRASDRAIMTDPQSDVAAIVFPPSDLPLPTDLLRLAPPGRYLRVDNQIGWFGFPSIAPMNMRFFTGHTSYYIAQDDAYLVDGVAVASVSGGPAFSPVFDSPTIVGAVSSYLASIRGSATLPGLCKIIGVVEYQRMIKAFQSLDDAKEKETTTEEVNLPAPEEKLTGYI